MPFSGKATYSAGTSLPELAEDVSDLVGIASPYETPLLDAIGDPARPARSTLHEWLEDTLLPNTDRINDAAFANPTTDTEFVVENVSRFRAGDQVRVDTTGEVLLVTQTNSATSTLTVVRSFGSSGTFALSNLAALSILGNASLEGDDAAAARFTTRSRKSNYTQIFCATVEVSGSELAAKQAGVADEMDYQKTQRLRELLRDLENTVINGRAASTNPQGSATVRRSMRGIIQSLTTHRFAVGVGGFPGDAQLTEDQLNLALRTIWKESAGKIDLVVVGGQQKRAINAFGQSARTMGTHAETFKRLVSVYESDFGVCRVVLCRSIPAGSVLLLDSSRIEVLPLGGRSFHYRPLACTGDRESGQVVGEYTLELRNESAHGLITGLG